MVGEDGREIERYLPSCVCVMNAVGVILPSYDNSMCNLLNIKMGYGE